MTVSLNAAGTMYQRTTFMLARFLEANRAAIVGRAQAQLRNRVGQLPTEAELCEGIPLFLDQLIDALRLAESKGLPDASAMIHAATRRGDALHRIGMTIAQVVQDYGDVCQSITELAVQQDAPISGQEFQTLNFCLDESIAGAVTAFASSREKLIEGKGNERVGILAHEMRNYLNTAMLTYESLRSGLVPINGSTGKVHLRSLQGLQSVIDRSLAEVRLEAGLTHPAPISVREFLEEAEIVGLIEARGRGIHFSVVLPKDRTLMIHGDQQVLAAAIANLLQNAFKFTAEKGHVRLTACAEYDRVHFDIEDECGGLPPGMPETLFEPFEQRNENRTGLGLGLSISRKAAAANGGTIRVRDLPGKGCVFTLDLPRYTATGE